MLPLHQYNEQKGSTVTLSTTRPEGYPVGASLLALSHYSAGVTARLMMHPGTALEPTWSDTAGSQLKAMTKASLAIGGHFFCPCPRSTWGSAHVRAFSSVVAA